MIFLYFFISYVYYNIYYIFTVISVSKILTFLKKFQTKILWFSKENVYLFIQFLHEKIQTFSIWSKLGPYIRTTNWTKWPLFITKHNLTHHFLFWTFVPLHQHGIPKQVRETIVNFHIQIRNIPNNDCWLFHFLSN